MEDIIADHLLQIGESFYFRLGVADDTSGDHHAFLMEFLVDLQLLLQHQVSDRCGIVDHSWLALN